MKEPTSSPVQVGHMSKTQWKPTHYGVGAGMLLLGLLVGRTFFPAEVLKPIIVEREKRVEVPVERIVEKMVPYEVVKFTDRVVEKRVEVPVERIVVRRVEVPVEKIVYRDIAVGVDEVRSKVYLAAWRSLGKGQSKSQVIAALGHPVRIRTWNGAYEEWYYANQIATATVTFFNDSVYSWSEP